MLHSILLYLDSAASAQDAIDRGVQLAQHHQARVRGLTLLDTREVEDSSGCEAAVYTAMAHTRLHRAEARQHSVRALLSRCCLDAGLNFDVRRVAGNPFEVLRSEAQFHDLVVASAEALGAKPRKPSSSEPPVADDTTPMRASAESLMDEALAAESLTTLSDKPARTDDTTPPESTAEALATHDGTGLSASELVELVLQGVQPMLVVRPGQGTPRRALLVYDGSESSGRAIRSFLAMNILPEGELRLLAVGPSESDARRSLYEMADYCRSHRSDLETGFARGPLRKVLLPYLAKWHADLVVLGAPRGNRLLRTLLGDAARDVLKRSSSALFMAC